MNVNSNAATTSWLCEHPHLVPTLPAMHASFEDLIFCHHSPERAPNDAASRMAHTNITLHNFLLDLAQDYLPRSIRSHSTSSMANASHIRNNRFRRAPTSCQPSRVVTVKRVRRDHMRLSKFTMPE